MRTVIRVSVATLTGGLLALSACSSGGTPGSGVASSGSAGADGGAAGDGAVHTASGISGSSLALRVGSVGQGKGPSHAYTLGQSTTESLTSLKYYVTSVTICEKLETGGGSGFQNPQNCLQIYSAPSGDYAYEPSGDYTGLAAAARGSDKGFVDLLDPASRATLGSSVVLSSKDAHAYNWGVITWVPVVKVTASVPMSDGSTWYTHDGTSSRTVQNGVPNYVTTSQGTFTSGPAEEAVVLSANGGTWFRFQHPFNIGAEAVAEGEAFVLDLTLDPDGLVTGGPIPGSGTLREGAGDAGGGGGGGGGARELHIPSLDLTPVPHLASTRAVRETYVADVAPGFRLRVELYTLDGDPNRTIYGVDTRTLYTGSSAWVSEFAKVSYLEPGDTGLTFQNWDKSPEISGFQRGTNVGDTGNAIVHCIPSGAPGGAAAAVIFDGCPMGGTIPVVFHLTAITPLGAPPAASDAGAPVADGGVDAAPEASDK
jgi:hypothetical protein